MNYSEHTYSSRDGLPLYYRSYGCGDGVVLCLPGLTRNSKDFHELAEHLSAQAAGQTGSHGAVHGEGHEGGHGAKQTAAGWRVLCPDLRGRGRSAYDPRKRYYPSVYAGDCWNLLDAAGVDRAAIIGTSLGGLVAMIMAEQRPQCVRGIVMNDIGPEVPPEAIARIMTYAGKPSTIETWEEAAAHVRQAYELAVPDRSHSFWLDYTRRNYREDGQGRPVQEVDPAVGDVARSPPAPVRFLRWLSQHGLLRRIGGASLDPWRSFRSVRVPCLVVHGEISDVLTQTIVERMMAAKPGLEVVTVPRRGHAPMLDEPEALDAIRKFLARLPA